MLFEDTNVVLLLALCVGWMDGWMHQKERIDRGQAASGTWVRVPFELSHHATTALIIPESFVNDVSPSLDGPNDIYSDRSLF